MGVAQKAAEGGRQRRITRAAEQPKYGLKMWKGGAFAPPLPPLNPPLAPHLITIAACHHYRLPHTVVHVCRIIQCLTVLYRQKCFVLHNCIIHTLPVKSMFNPLYSVYMYIVLLCGKTLVTADFWLVIMYVVAASARRASLCWRGIKARCGCSRPQLVRVQPAPSRPPKPPWRSAQNILALCSLAAFRAKSNRLL